MKYILLIIGITLILFNIVNIIRVKKTKKQRDELYNRRVKFLHHMQYEYYYTLAINNPVELCNFLATRDIENLKKKNKILALYTKAKKRIL